jgi:inner membrane protein
MAVSATVSLRSVAKNCHDGPAKTGHDDYGMPTPIGHAIGGLAAAFLTNSFARRPELTPGVLLACVGVAIAPDLDILASHHRSYTHSVGATAIVGLASWLVLRRRVSNAPAVATALTAAYGSHLLLDWLGKDTSRPPGLTIFWPFSSEYFMSGLDFFGEVSRRYWLFNEFILGNVRAVSWELALLTPLLIFTWARWSKRTLSRQSQVDSR